MNTANTEQRLLSAAARQLGLYSVAAITSIAALMFVLNWLAGLTSSADVSGGAVDVENNVVTAYLREEPPQLNSMVSSDAVSTTVLDHILEGLLRYDPQGNLMPGMAERWEQDGDVVTFHLRDNARWSNGDPVTAHDFVFAWKTVVSPATASQYAFILYPILNAEKINNGELPPDALGVQALDDYTLQVTLERPISYFNHLVAFKTYAPVNEKFFRSTHGRYGADADEMIYNGPFVMESWVHGSSLRLAKNPDYWDAERIQLDGINYTHMTSDPNTLLNLFKDGQIVMTDLVSAQMLEEAMLQGWELGRFMDGTVFFIEFNFRDGRLTRNQNLRKALYLAQSSSELVNRVIKLPGYLPAKSLYPVWLPGAETTLREEYPAPVYERNVELAREYLQKALDELGLERLPPLTLLTSDTPLSRMMAEYFQEVFTRSLGIEIAIDAQIFRQRLAKMTSGDFDIVMSGWAPDYNDAMTFGDRFASWNLNNRGRYSNPDLDAQVRIAQNSLDVDERMRAFAEIQQIVYEDVVIIPNYERGIVYATDPRVKGIVRRAIGAEVDFTYAYIEADD